MDKQLSLKKEIQSALIDFLKPYEVTYSNELFDFHVEIGEKLFKINGKYKNEERNSGMETCIMLSMTIMKDFPEIQITNIFIPKFMKYNGIGKKMIAIIFELAEKYDYEVFLVHMVDNFFYRMIKRGALPCNCNYEAVKIVKETQLT